MMINCQVLERKNAVENGEEEKTKNKDLLRTENFMENEKGNNENNDAGNDVKRTGEIKEASPPTHPKQRKEDKLDLPIYFHD